ncbi:MAG: O-antigen ligase family protein [bacterium]|nr:O-antigen ligase family protein [bacterium]
MIRQSDAGTAAAAFILLLMVCLGPLYFGSVLPRERIALQIGAFLALALALAGKRELIGLRPIKVPLMTVALVGVYGILQSLPWPGFLVAFVSPRLAEVWRSAGTITETATATIPLSLAPAVSRGVGLHWLAVAAVLAAATLVGAERHWRRLLAASLLVAALFEIVYGSDNWFSRRDTIWGLEVGGDPSRLRGTFINPDHLALFLALPAACGFAWLWWSIRRMLRYGSLERRLLQAVLPSLVFLMLFVGLAFTGSRAGLVSIVAAILVQGVMLAIYYRTWRVGAASTGALALGLLGIGLFGLQQGLGRWMETSAYEVTWNSRLLVYRSSFELWQLFPWTGTGLGTFRQAFPMVQPPELSMAWLHAHSDPIEMLVTTGVVGLPILAWGLVALYRRLWTVFQRGRRSEDRAAGVAALGALVGVLLHSFVDFGLTLPANTFVFAILCGAACGAATRARRSDRDQDAGSPADDSKSRTRPG